MNFFLILQLSLFNRWANPINHFKWTLVSQIIFEKGASCFNYNYKLFLICLSGTWRFWSSLSRISWSFPLTLKAGQFMILTGLERQTGSPLRVLTTIDFSPVCWDWARMEFGVPITIQGQQASGLVNQLKMKYKCLPFSF